jgi:hypothetical protein
MTDTDESRSRRIIAFAVPMKVATATKALAAKEYSTLSQVCRRALVRDLKEAGLLTELEFA